MAGAPQPALPLVLPGRLSLACCPGRLPLCALAPLCCRLSRWWVVLRAPQQRLPPPVACPTSARLARARYSDVRLRSPFSLTLPVSATPWQPLAATCCALAAQLSALAAQEDAVQNAIHAARSLTPPPASRAPAGELLAKVRFVCRILQTFSRPRGHCEGGCRENLSVAPLASVSASVPLARASAEPTLRAEPLATDATLRGETFEGVKWRAFFLFSGCEPLGFCLLLMACPHGRLS